MTLSQVYDECLRRFASKGLKAEQLQLTAGQLNIVLPPGTIHIEYYGPTPSLGKPIFLEPPTSLRLRKTTYAAFNNSFFARIEKAIDKVNEIALNVENELQAQKAKHIELEKNLIPYIKEYGNVFEVKNGAVYLVIGKTSLRINLETERVLLMSFNYNNLHIPIHLFIPLLREMQMEQLLGA